MILELCALKFGRRMNKKIEGIQFKFQRSCEHFFVICTCRVRNVSTYVLVFTFGNANDNSKGNCYKFHIRNPIWILNPKWLDIQHLWLKHRLRHNYYVNFIF